MFESVRPPTRIAGGSSRLVPAARPRLRPQLQTPPNTLFDGRHRRASRQRIEDDRQVRFSYKISRIIQDTQG